MATFLASNERTPVSGKDIVQPIINAAIKNGIRSGSKPVHSASTVDIKPNAFYNLSSKVEDVLKQAGQVYKDAYSNLLNDAANSPASVYAKNAASSGSVTSAGAALKAAAAAQPFVAPQIDGLHIGNIMAGKFGMSSASGYEEALANTAHQREVQDLLAAGLNPVLSANGGSGAPVVSAVLPEADSSGGSVSGHSAKKNATSNVLGKLVGAVASLAGARSSSAKALGTIAEYGLKLFE